MDSSLECFGHIGHRRGIPVANVAVSGGGIGFVGKPQVHRILKIGVGDRCRDKGIVGCIIDQGNRKIAFRGSAPGINRFHAQDIGRGIGLEIECAGSAENSIGGLQGEELVGRMGVPHQPIGKCLVGVGVGGTEGADDGTDRLVLEHLGMG